MKIRVRPKSRPINRLTLAAIGCGAVAFVSWPEDGDPLQGIFAAVYAAASGVLALSVGYELVQDFRRRRDVAIAAIVTDDHGTAREATSEEVAERGMFDPMSGALIGIDKDGQPVFAPRNMPFCLCESPPGGGKTASLVIGEILHKANCGYSLVIPDAKLDLAPRLARPLREMGFEVWAVNPTGKFAELCGDTPINPYQALIDAVHGQGEQRKNAVKLASDYADLHYPENGKELNPYFRRGSKRIIVVVVLLLAITDPGRCTPTHVYAVLADPAALTKTLKKIASLETEIRNDPLVRFLKKEAKTLLHREKEIAENFASFLEGATQRLMDFNEAGHLSEYGKSTPHRVSELRERQIIMFIMAPLSHGRALADYLSFLNHNVIAACKEMPEGRPVHIVGEEALNYEFKDIVSTMETLRELGVSASFYIQSYAGLVKRYGREAAQAIESYCGVRIYAGLNAIDRAKYVSEQLSEYTIRKQDFSLKADVQDVGISSRELSRRLMMPDEILSMPRNEAWVFVSGMRPMRLRLVHYGQVAPWRDWVGASPITGELLYEDPIFSITYPEKPR